MRKKGGMLNRVFLVGSTILIYLKMKELTQDELMNLNGGSPATMNYIGGLAPAIPPSGGDFIVGFFKGLIKSLFS